MLYIAYFSLVIYIISVLNSMYSNIKFHNFTFGMFILSLILNGCVIYSLIYLILLL